MRPARTGSSAVVPVAGGWLAGDWLAADWLAGAWLAGAWLAGAWLDALGVPEVVPAAWSAVASAPPARLAGGTTADAAEAVREAAAAARLAPRLPDGVFTRKTLSTPSPTGDTPHPASWPESGRDAAGIGKTARP